MNVSFQSDEFPWNNVTDFISEKIESTDDDLQLKFMEENSEMTDLASYLIALEHSIFYLRRAQGVCGSNIDSLTIVYDSYIGFFEDKFGEWKSPNKEHMW